MGYDISSLHDNLYQGIPDRERQVWSRPGPRSREARRNRELPTSRPSSSGPRPQQHSRRPSRQPARQPSRHPSQRQPGRNVQDHTSQMPIYDDDHDHTSEEEEDPDYVTESVGLRGRRGDPVVGASSPPSRRPNSQTHPSHPRPLHPHLTSRRSSHSHPAGLSSRPHSPPPSHYRASAAPHPQGQPYRHPHPRNPPTLPAHIIDISPGPREEMGGIYESAAPEPSTRNRERAPSRQGSQKLGGWRERESFDAANPRRHLSPRPGPRGEGTRRYRDSQPGLSSRQQPPFPASHPQKLSTAPSYPRPSHYPLPSAVPRPQPRNTPTVYAGPSPRGDRVDNDRDKSTKREPSSNYSKRAANDQGSRKGVELLSAANPKSNPIAHPVCPPPISHGAPSSSAPLSPIGRTVPGLRAERNHVDIARNARLEPPINLSKPAISRPESSEKAGENLGAATPSPQSLFPVSAAAPHTRHAPTAYAMNPGSGLGGERDGGDGAGNARPEPTLNPKRAVCRQGSLKQEKGSSAANLHPQQLTLSSHQQPPPPPPPPPFHTRPSSSALPSHLSAPAAHPPLTSHHAPLSSAPTPHLQPHSPPPLSISHNAPLFSAQPQYGKGPTLHRHTYYGPGSDVRGTNATGPSSRPNREGSRDTDDRERSELPDLFIRSRENGAGCRQGRRQEVKKTGFSRTRRRGGGKDRARAGLNVAVVVAVGT